MISTDRLRSRETVAALAQRIAQRTTRPWNLMEVCGGQTHSIVRYGIDQWLPETIRLLHGPGCPVCVTPARTIDQALALANIPGMILCSYGDLLRVPGTSTDLLGARAAGADVRVVYSPLETVRIAVDNPSRPVVFVAIGFETTAPAHALLLETARSQSIQNLSLLVAQVRVPPALAALASDPESRIDAFLAAGHVCTVMGDSEYVGFVENWKKPVVVTGFEPVDLLRGVWEAVDLLESGRADVVHAYERVARPGGNPAARERVERIFTPVEREWRGLGNIPHSGWGLAPEWAEFDAELRFAEALGAIASHESEQVACRAGDVLTGRLRPRECPEFGTRCTPETPLGAPMVSGEGACAAWYRYRGATPLPVAGQ
jgi:hydrogenase expression/formation protein HypD